MPYDISQSPDITVPSEDYKFEDAPAQGTVVNGGSDNGTRGSIVFVVTPDLSQTNTSDYFPSTYSEAIEVPPYIVEDEEDQSDNSNQLVKITKEDAWIKTTVEPGRIIYDVECYFVDRNGSPFHIMGSVRQSAELWLERLAKAIRFTELQQIEIGPGLNMYVPPSSARPLQLVNPFTTNMWDFVYATGYSTLEDSGGRAYGYSIRFEKPSLKAYTGKDDDEFITSLATNPELSVNFAAGSPSIETLPENSTNDDFSDNQDYRNPASPKGVTYDLRFPGLNSAEAVVPFDWPVSWQVVPETNTYKIIMTSSFNEANITASLPKRSPGDVIDYIRGLQDMLRYDNNYTVTNNLRGQIGFRAFLKSYYKADRTCAAVLTPNEELYGTEANGEPTTWNSLMVTNVEIANEQVQGWYKVSIEFTGVR